MDEQKKNTRRRGEILEEAIMNATWDEMLETGYTSMTMESIATRAGTNKSVLYRRWADKSALVIVAIHKNLPRITNEIPDTGNLRDDVYAYLYMRIGPLKMIGPETVKGLMMEPMVWRNLIAAMPQMMEQRSENKLAAAMTAILKNAELRGEVCLEKLSPYIISLPINLLTFEIISKMGAISDTIVTEIVDDVFIPLVQATVTSRSM